ncbi:hypothetical protein CFC21_105553 [Triticum aestivum]|uniref:F-box domain-containing protein n=2 Tax=Triticum aestivum TaxID=4565 RepID=A0A3B6SST4_WHEAT|nr:hypothetical protein CFC21_105553 [Triticum aestivum]
MESRSGRRRLRSSSPTEDRISTLPDDLLLLILARLRSIAAAVRTSVLSRRWSGSGGLWTRLHEIVFRDITFPSLEAALGRVVDPPAVSLLEIRVPDVHRPGTETNVGGLGFNSLLRAAAQLAPEEFVFRFPWDLTDRSLVVDMPCFPRTTSIVLVNFFLFLRVPDGVDFLALETLSLSGRLPDLDPWLSCCPRLHALRLRRVFSEGELRVISASLHELSIFRLYQRMHGINIVAPMLKQLTMSFFSSGASISVLAPMVEKVSWDCRYSKPSIVFGLWRLEQVTLQMGETQGHVPTLQICAHAVRLFSPLNLLQSFD